MKKGFYTVIMSQNIHEESRFYKELFAFEETFTSDWYISLISEGFELALVDSSHETIPANFRKEAQGLIINVEVENVDELYTRIKGMKNVPILLEIKDEAFGQRHFIIESPSKIVVDIIQEIPPSAEFSENFKEVPEDHVRK